MYTSISHRNYSFKNSLCIYQFQMDLTMALDQQNFKDICRACLSQKNLEPLEGPKIIELFSECVDLKVKIIVVLFPNHLYNLSLFSSQLPMGCLIRSAGIVGIFVSSGLNSSSSFKGTMSICVDFFRNEPTNQRIRRP